MQNTVFTTTFCTLTFAYELKINFQYQRCKADEQAHHIGRKKTFLEHVYCLKNRSQSWMVRMTENQLLTFTLRNPQMGGSVFWANSRICRIKQIIFDIMLTINSELKRPKNHKQIIGGVLKNRQNPLFYAKYSVYTHVLYHNFCI